LQIFVDALFHFSWKLRRRPYQPFGIDPQRDFFEYGKGNPAAGFSRSERTIVVKADAHSDRDSCGAVTGAYKERIPEFICRSRLAYHRYRETAGVKRVGRPSGQTNDTAHAFLNEQESQALDMNRGRRAFAFIL
jgi:hypothetical protein